jgi:K+-transporting ATPase KdpF subunit
MNATILLAATKPTETNTTAGYIAGAVIALFVLAYLIYSLIKPEKL